MSHSVNGACGPANGTTATVAPSAGLCTAGTASAVTGAGPWTWQCADDWHYADCDLQKLSTLNISVTDHPLVVQVN
jgi:hypothetical protein